jgi:sugar lactone lactonase YvrE
MGGGCPPAGGTTTGSCCAADGTCLVTAQADCSTGTWTAGATCTPNPCTPAATPVTPQLYVANFTGSSVLSYLNPKTVNGNQAPSTNISGAQTGLTAPADIAVTASGILIALNFAAVPASITAYPGAATANGNVVPARNVQGANTGLLAPVTTAISAANDLAFVANTAGTFDINVFAGASTTAFLGNLAPTRTIKSAALNAPRGINFGASDTLYVANGGNNTVIVFNNASTRNGTITPDRTLTNAAFLGVFDCFVDAADTLYVVNGPAGGNRIHVINNASTKNGAVTIDATLTVTGAVNLTSIAVDKTQTGYIVDNAAPGGGAVYSYDAINTKNGAFAPDRSITGAATQLSGPIRVFLVE